jgi:ABC-type spermidine/putrescine transport system permease subunit I
MLFSATFVVSLIGLFPSYNMLLSDFNQSGFLQFFSLTFSDFSIVATYWKSFTMTLLQTLPALSLALFLAVLLTFLQSIKSLIKYEQRYFSIKNI